MADQGKLFVIATPIGNLEDLSPRAEQAIRQSDRIIAEDTRRTRKLLSHLDAPKPLSSLHQHSSKEKTEKFIRKLKKGKILGLATDAGTPGVSDPGWQLVQKAHDEDIKVVPIPGPSAVTTALSASGAPADTFTFIGFLPKSETKKEKVIEQFDQYLWPIVIFSPPHGVKQDIEALAAVYPEKRVTVTRELSKKFEEIWKEKVAQARSRINEKEPKGEYTLILSDK